MPIDREAMLRKFIEQKPEDPFPRYALAIELMNGGRSEDAVTVFAALVERIPGYVPTYLHYAATLGKLGRRDEAKTVLGAGIERARGAGDGHALGELQGALASL